MTKPETAHATVVWLLCLAWVHTSSGVLPTAARLHAAQPRTQSSSSDSAADYRALLDRYCVTCHNTRLRTADLALDSLDLTDVGAASDVWEQVVHKLRADLMPPPGRPRPDRARYDGFRVWLESALDRVAAADPDPGRVPTHRLNRAEYANAIRDLLALEIDGETLLPADDTGHGFDNLAGTLALSPALMERYLSAARRVSRLAVGDPAIPASFTSETYTVPITLVQNDRMSEDLPFGSRGGLAIRHRFPLDGEYVIRVRLTRSVYEYIVNLDETHELDVRVDGRRVARFQVGAEHPGTPAPVSFSGTFVAAGGTGYPTQAWDDYRTSADAGLEVRFPATAGTRVVSVSFVGKSWEAEGVHQPPLREYGATVTETTDTSLRPEGPGVGTVTIDGPFDATGPGDTTSRARLFVCRPASPAEERSCARSILSTVARRAFRRPVTERDLEPLLPFFDTGRARGGFDEGIRTGLERILIDPEFLFRIERDPVGATPGSIYRLTDLELASRLSFFLWSSIPDDELLDLAARGRLSAPATLDRQVRRMVADARSTALVDNFASQWLSLRSVRGITPDPNLFPDFDENLRRAFQQETTLFLLSQLRDDRSVIDLLRADYTFLNERLARHYGIAGVVGSRFRRVRLDDDRRGGLLGHGSILAVTSYGNRTSPVLRAKWLLDSVLGTPPPPPPPNIPALPGENATGTPRSVRERLAQHRRNPACAACHATMDPLGFALENFDAVGRWRTSDAGAPIDATAVLADGTIKFRGPAGLRNVLLRRSDQFVETVAEKLLTYAIGRGLEPYDRPVLRAIRRDTTDDEHRWSALILGIVKSAPFQLRRSE
jgi:mono/diheme cytochrome c family protein